MKKKIALTTAFLIILNLGELSFGQQIRKFTSTTGKEINASIVAATDSDVTLKLDNGKTTTGGIKFFSASDQEYIRTWVAQNPQEKKFGFEIKVTKERTGRDKSNSGNHIYTNENWVYKIQIENKSKSGNTGTPVSGATLEYNVLVSPKARMSVESSSPKDLTSSGRYRVLKGKISLPEIAYLGKSEHTTAVFPLNQSELAPGWYYTDGTKDEKKDDLEGILIQIVKETEILAEKKIGTQDLESARWTAP